MADKPQKISLKTVVVINDFCHVKGGTSRVAIDEAVALAGRGINVLFFGAVGPVGAELISVPNLTVICLDQPEIGNVGRNPLIALQGLWNFKAARVLAHALRGLAPPETVVHLHGYSKALTASIVRPIFAAKFPLIHTLHDYFLACPNGGFFNYTNGKICPLRGASLSCLRTSCDKKNYVHKIYRFVKTSLQIYAAQWPSRAQNFIYLSEASLRYVKPYLPPNAALHFLENINETPRAPPVAAEKNTDFIFVGQLDPHKGIRHILSAAQRAKTPIVFVGEGPLRGDIERAGYKVTGWLPRHEVQNRIEKARCLVFPSLWCETYGLVVSEAVARGVPAIVSDVTAAAERIEPEQSGWIYKTGDAEDLRRCLTEAQDDRTIAAYGRAAYDKFWAAPPTSEAHIQRLLDIYPTLRAS